MTVPPEHLDMLRRAVEHHQAGRLDAAESLYRQIIGGEPDNAGAHFNLAQALLRAGRFDEAIVHLSKVAEMEPSNPQIQLMLANACDGCGRMDDALLHIRRAIALDPRAEYHSTLGEFLRRTQDVAGALAAHETAVALKPNDTMILHNYGAALHAAQRLTEAQDVFQRALALDATFLKTYVGLAKVYEHQGHFDRAIATLSAALARDPQSPDLRFKLSLLQLAGGDFSGGWPNYAARMEDADAHHPRRPPPPAYWAGEDLSAKRILVWTEQGVGDEILHASMMPDLIARAGRCILECSARMAPIFARSFSGAKVVAYVKPEVAVTSEPVDFQTAAGDLGRYLRRDLGAFPRQPGYLKADSARSAQLRARYQAVAPKNLIVGIAWRSANPEIGALKSADLAAWGALLGVPGITFVSLQYGDCAAELAAVKSALNVDIFRDKDVDPLKSMDDFFAQVAATDLVISTSNTTVHVAGSLNIPVWLLNADGPGSLWYWFRRGTDVPWYPSMRVFRASLEQVRGDSGPWRRQGVAAASRALEDLKAGYQA